MYLELESNGRAYYSWYQNAKRLGVTDWHADPICGTPKTPLNTRDVQRNTNSTSTHSTSYWRKHLQHVYSGRLEKHTYAYITLLHYGWKVCAPSESLCWNLTTQSNVIKRLGPWEAIRMTRGLQVEASIVRLWDSESVALFRSMVNGQHASSPKWTQCGLPACRTVENKCLLFIKITQVLVLTAVQAKTIYS